MIPWVGDIVKLNPELEKQYRIRGGLAAIVGSPTKVLKVEIHHDAPNLVLVTLESGSVDIRLPEGRFFTEAIGVPSLLALVSGDSHHPFTKGTEGKSCLYPIPVPGDEFIIADPVLPGGAGKNAIVEACDCNAGPRFPDGNHWPFGEMQCGAHMNWGGGLCYNMLRNGWCYSGELLRSGVKVAQESPRNNDGRSECFWCHIPTGKRGGGAYDICPKCGR